jgi:hypothetical protein
MEFMEEIWKPICGCENSYEISNLGRVKSLPRSTHYTDKNNVKCVRNTGGMVLNPPIDAEGYVKVILFLNGKRVARRVHRLVAEQFIPNPENKPYVNHIDGIKYNNNVVNLEWCTASENTQHAFDTGLVVVKSGQDSPLYKGTIEVYDHSGTLVDTLYGNLDIKNKGYDPSCVSKCVLGKAKKHRGCTFKRAQQ